MSYCPNCGEKIVEKTNFCGKCGNLLHSEISNTSSKNLNRNININLNNSNLINSIINYLKFIIHPYKETENFIKKNNTENTYITILLSIIFQSLLYFWKVNQIYNNIFNFSKSFIINILNGILSFLGQDIFELDVFQLMDINDQLSAVKDYFPIDGGKILFQGLLMSSVTILIMFISIYIITRRSNLTLTLKVVTLSTIPIVYGGLFSILLSYLNEGLGLAIFIFAIFYSIGSLYTNVCKYLLNGKPAILELSIVMTILLIAFYTFITKLTIEQLSYLFNKIIQVFDLF